MRKTLLAILLALALVAILVGSVFAASTAGVTVTATPGWVSITNAPIDYDFDVVLAGIDEDTGIDYFTITNASTVDMDISIECDGWAGAVNSWTYGAPAEDTARLAASDGDGAYDVTLAVDSGTLLIDAVAVGTHPSWELELQVPTSFTYVDEQTTMVTLTASAD